MPSLGVIPSEYRHTCDIRLKLDYLGYISFAECVDVSSTTFT